MSKLEKILALVRSINQDEFQEQLTHGDSLDDVYEELLFLAEKIESKKKRTAIIVDHISNCFAGDFFNYLPISDAQDELDVFCMGFNTYIEELKSTMVSRNLLENINEKLMQEKVRSEQITLSRDQFLSNVSYQIRTPLMAVLGFTDLLLGSSSLHPEQKTHLEYIKTSGNVLLLIMNDILDLSKMESKQLVLAHAPFDLIAITGLVQETFGSSMKDKQIDFKIVLDKDLPAVLYGDSARITQLLFNLINNALLFTTANGNIRLKIKFLDEEADFYVVKIVVSHSGAGIPAAELNKVFHPFVQLTGGSNSGLELTIVKKMVALMKGSVQVKSKIGVGTKFVVTLPFFKKHAGFLVSKTTSHKESFNLLSISNTMKIKVLIADDNHINQILAQKILAKFDIDTVAVVNGQLAVEAVIQEDYDLILMDLIMPVMDGYEATLAIRELEHPTKKNIPIIALSALLTDSVIEECQKVGMNNYITKPFDATELYNMILELVTT